MNKLKKLIILSLLIFTNLILIGTVNANSIIAYPDIFKLLANTEIVAPDLLIKINSFMKNECEAKKFKFEHLCRFTNTLNRFQTQEKWISESSKFYFSLYSENEGASNLIEIRNDWNELDIRSLNWGLGIGTATDPKIEWDVVESVLNYLFLKKRLLEDTNSLKKIFSYWSGETADASTRILIPLIESWLYSPFIFQKALYFSNSQQCRSMDICLGVSSVIEAILQEVLRKYERRILDVMNAIESDSIYYGSEHKALHDFLSNVNSVDEYIRSGNVTDELKDKILNTVIIPPSLDLKRFQTLSYLLKVNELYVLINGLSNQVIDKSEEMRIGMHVAKDYPGYKELKEKIDKEIKDAIKYFENRFSNRQKEIKS